MADSDLKINVTTTADLTGLDEVQAKMLQLQETQKGFLAPIPPQLLGLAAPIEQATAEAKNLNTEASKLPDWLNIGRFQAAALSRELTNGTLNARSLGTSLASFGGPISVAAIGLFTIVDLILKASQEQDKWTDEVLKTTAEMEKLGESILRAQDDLRETQIIMNAPLGAGLQMAQQQLERLKTEQSLVNLQTVDGLNEYKKYGEEIAKTQRLVDELTKKQGSQADTVQRITDQIALNNASGNEELTIQLKVQAVHDATLRTLREKQVPEKLAADLANEAANSERQKLETIAGQAPAQSTYNELLKQAEIIIQGIRQQQQLIQSSPFMGADEKSVALLKSYTTEMQQLQQIINGLQAQKAAGGLDPAQQEQVNQKLQQTNFEMQSLSQKVLALQAPLRTELTSWANSFGTTAHQIGQTIQQTIGAALQSVNQFLVTGKFNAQALLQQIATLGLQLLEQMAIQRLMSLFNQNAAVAQAAVTGPLVAAAWGPAATAVSVATQGGADVAATSAFALTLSSIQGMLALQHGGFVPGHGTGDTVPAMLTPGEFVVNRHSAAAIGYGNLEEMNMYAAGGMVRATRRNYGLFDNLGNIDSPWNFPVDEWGFPINIPISPGGSGTSFTPDDTGGGGTGGGGTPSTSGGGGTPYVPFVSPTIFAPRGGGQPGGFNIPGGINWSPGSPGGSLGTAGGKMALHSSIMQNWAHTQGYRSVGDWMRRSGFTLPTGGGGGQGLSGAGRGMTKNFARGGMVSGGGPQVHVYPVMDRKAIIRDMASKEGHKLIFDVVKGRRIDLGMK